jgi:hypothetical protein
MLHYGLAVTLGFCVVLCAWFSTCEHGPQALHGPTSQSAAELKVSAVPTESSVAKPKRESLALRTGSER